MKSSRSNFRLWFRVLAFVITTGLLYYIYITYDLTGLLGHINVGWLVLFPAALLVQFVNRLVSAFQITRFLNAYKLNMPTFTVLRAQLISWFYTLFLPGYLAGGGITWYLLTHKNKKHAETVNALVVVQIVNLLVLFIVSFLAAIQDPVIRNSGFVFHIALGACILGLCILPFLSQRINAFTIGRIGRLIPGLTKLSESTKVYLHLGFKGVLEQIALSLIAVVTSAVTAKILLDMTGIDVPFSTYLWLGGLMTAIHMLPITFAGTGLREITMISLLGALYQAPPDRAVLFSLLNLAMTLITGFCGAALQFFNVTEDHKASSS